MLKTLRYQQDAIDDLLKKTLDILSNYGLRDRTKLQLKAPPARAKP